MEGNRVAYIKKTEQFVDELKQSFSFNNYRVTDDKLIKKITKVNEIIENYYKQTQKSYYILQEFFANESHKVAI